MIQMRLSEVADVLQASSCGDDVQFTGCSTDTRTLSGGEMYIALRGENFDGHDFVDQAISKGAVAAMVESPIENMSSPLLLVPDTREALGKLAGVWRQKFDLSVIAVTGSNGKTTVKDMLASILSRQAPVLATRGNLNNDIGVPLTLFGLHEQHRFAVIEMGANHAGEIAALTAITRPTVALITLCSPAHIEGFGSVSGVADAKAEIFSGLLPDGVAVINIDDEYAASWCKKAGDREQLSFGLDESADISARNIELGGHAGSSHFVLTTPKGDLPIKLNLLGMHNIKNALAAAACCIAIDIPLQNIKDGLQAMQAGKGRMQCKPGIKNSRIIDDTYNANPASLNAAMEVVSGLSNRCWLVLGDMGELGNMAESSHQQAGENARAAGIERLYALGQLSTHAVRAFGSGARHFADKDALILALSEEVEAGLTVLVKGSRSMAMEDVVHALVEEV